MNSDIINFTNEIGLKCVAKEIKHQLEINELELELTNTYSNVILLSMTLCFASWIKEIMNVCQNEKNKGVCLT